MKKQIVSSILLLAIIGLGIAFFVYWNKKGALDNDILYIPSTGVTETTDTVTTNQTSNTSNIKTMENPIVVLHTTEGDIELELFASAAPVTVKNFTDLVSQGFYNGTRFHRVIEGFMIQGGDPLSKDDAMMMRWGTGGPGYQFADEIHADNHNVVGTISMANAGPNTNGSQFFINTADNTFLDTKHTVFGKVVKGMDVVMTISQTPTDNSDRPVDAITVTSVEVR